MEVQDYGFGRIVIDGKEYTEDVIVFPDRVRDRWWRKEGHFLQTDDLEEVFEEEPGKLIIGTGHDGVMKVSKKVFEKCRDMGIEVSAEKSRKACEMFNKEKDAVLAIHLTC